MKPLSPHWADQAATRVIGTRGEKSSYVVASGITPSGLVHIGNFREVITVDLVARALRSLGKSVRFIYSWDNFDTFRKVPKNLPDPASFEKFLRQPIARIPDPWGTDESYAAGRIANFESDLEKVGIKPEYLYQERRYASGCYADLVRQALEKKAGIKKILDEFRATPLPDNWLPTSVYCEKCSRDEMDYERYDGEWNYSYKCSSCGFESTTDIRKTKNLKLAWRTDWPMRWHYEQVDFEPGGKDHSSEGGSYDTAKKIVTEVWGSEPPVYLQYDFVAIKGGAGKMSSSSGELYTLGQVLKVYDAQIVRWLFANQRPNHDFSLAFDEDVFRLYDEFDRAEENIFSADGEKNNKWPLIKRTYELSTVDGQIPEIKPFRPPFRELCNRLQICNLDVRRTYERYYRDLIDLDSKQYQYYEVRAESACHWLQNYAPEEFCYKLRQERQLPPADNLESKAWAALQKIVMSEEFDTLSAKDLHQRIYEDVIKFSECPPDIFFKMVYQRLIGRDQGPRLAAFLKEIGKERLLLIF